MKLIKCSLGYFKSVALFCDFYKTHDILIKTHKINFGKKTRNNSWNCNAQNVLKDQIQRENHDFRGHFTSKQFLISENEQVALLQWLNDSLSFSTQLCKKSPQIDMFSLMGAKMIIRMLTSLGFIQHPIILLIIG